jgi:hypothetical protein
MLLHGMVGALQPPLSVSERRAVAFAVIEGLNLWAGFSRAYFLSCALGAREKGGLQVQPSGGVSPTKADAVTVAVHAVRPKLRTKSGPWSYSEEPKWHMPPDFLKALGRLGPSNMPTIHGAFGYQTYVFDDIRVCRNFFAHRNEDTAAEVAAMLRAPRYGVTARRHASDAICERAPSRPQPIVADWLDDIRIVIELLTL